MQVFISHSHSDSPLAARVSRALRKAGLQVWDPEVHLLPGDNWPAQVGRALEESDAMVVLLTPNSISSPHVRADMSYALGSKSYRNRLIPVAVGGREQLPKGRDSLDRPKVALGGFAEPGERRSRSQAHRRGAPQPGLSADRGITSRAATAATPARPSSRLACTWWSGSHATRRPPAFRRPASAASKRGRTAP